MCLAVALALGSPLGAQTAKLDPFLVSATRGAPPPEQMPVAVTVFSAERLAAFPAITLDDTLREDPGFSLFRRTSSLTSNPTSQGVSLRGIGPSGASRSLVLLDGIPLNDPFGGWVVWSGAPRLSLTRAQIVRGGGSGLWGNAALAGSIQLIDATPPSGTGRADAAAGAFGTHSGEVSLGESLGAGSIGVDARDFATDGFYNLAAANRGRVDRPFNSAHRFAQVRLQQPLGGGVEAIATGRLFTEKRGNGTVLQNNASRAGLASLLLDGAPHPGFAWSAVGYAQHESFASFFSSVSADRATETPANNQFNVPASAAGAALTADWSGEAGVSTVAGLDYRQVIGETREYFQYASGAFSRIRFAGGAQAFAGAFVHHDRLLAPGWRLSGDLRFDRWENRSGHDREYNLANGAPTLLAVYPARSGGAFSPNLGLVWQASPAVRWRAAAYHGFRLPTLNEYYRPFRVGTVTTNANPNLHVETLNGAEAGVEASAGAWQGGLTAFADELYHSVGTVTISSTPAATTVQRQNLDVVRVRGLEAFARWTPVEGWRLRAGYLWDDSRVVAAAAEPDLVGLRLPEVPRSTLTAQADWDAPFGLKIAGRVRWVALQFDDNANTLRLPAAGIADLEISRRCGRHLELYLAAENIGNTAVAASLSTAGLFTYDAPRFLRGGARVNW